MISLRIYLYLSDTKITMGQVWNGTAILSVYDNQTVNNPTNTMMLNIDLSQALIAWDSGGPPPNLTNSDTLAFTLPSGYTASYLYSYDLHGHTGGGSPVPQLVSTIHSTDNSENPLNSSIPVNFNGTDWWYGPSVNSDHPLFNVGTMNNPPKQIIYNYSNTNQITQATWNIYINVRISSNGVDGLSWGTIALIVFGIIFIIIILYYLIYYFESPGMPPNNPSHGTT